MSKETRCVSCGDKAILNKDGMCVDCQSEKVFEVPETIHFAGNSQKLSEEDGDGFRDINTRAREGD